MDQQYEDALIPDMNPAVDSDKEYNERIKQYLLNNPIKDDDPYLVIYWVPRSLGYFVNFANLCPLPAPVWITFPVTAGSDGDNGSYADFLIGPNTVHQWGILVGQAQTVQANPWIQWCITGAGHRIGRFGALYGINQNAVDLPLRRVGNNVRSFR